MGNVSDTIILDYSDFSGATLASTANVADTTVSEATRIDSDVLQFESKTTASSFLYWRIPGPLPVGANVELQAEVRHISGANACLLGLDSYSDATYGGNAGTGANKELEDNVVTDLSGEFKVYKANFQVFPRNRYARAVVGHFDAAVGVCQIRNVKVKLTGVGVKNALPDLSPTSARQFYSNDVITRQWLDVVDGTGTLVRGASTTDMVADYASRSYVISCNANNNTARAQQGYKEISASKGFTVKVKGTRNSGWPGIYVDYLDSGNVTLDSLRCYFTGGTDETQSFWFPAYPGAATAAIAVGFFTTNMGDFELESIEVIQHDAPIEDNHLGLQPVVGTLKKVSGTWEIYSDSIGDGSLRPKASNLATVADSGTYLTVTMKSVSSIPVIVAQVNDEANGAQSYYTATESASISSFRVVFRDAGSQALVSPAAIANDTEVNIVGFSTR